MPLAAHRGSITLELVIAFAVFALVLASVVLMLAGQGGTALVRESDELSLASEMLAQATHAEYGSVESATTSIERNEISYALSQVVQNLTPCMKSIEAVASTEGGKTLLSGLVSDSALMTALGGDCETEATQESWAHADALESEDIPGASGTAIDVLDGAAYVGLSAPPYLAIADTTSGKFVSFGNGFVLPAAPNDLDAVLVNDKRYVFAALDATSSQLAVIDATDAANPELIALRTLRGVNPDGSYPEGYRVMYYGGRAYIATRETSGPEFHNFDVDDPEVPYELGAGTELGSTGNDMAFLEQGSRRYLFLASARDSAELSVFDATDAYDTGALTEIAADRIDLPGSQDGESLALVGDTLYFGRASNTTGPELYLLDVSHVPEGAPLLLGSGEVGSKDVSGITVSGSLAFITATLEAASTRRLEVWNIADLAHPVRVLQVSVLGIAPGGLDFSRDELFITGSTTLEAFESD